MFKRRTYIWTPEDDERLRTLAADGVVLSRIAVAMARTENSIKYRARKLKIAIRKTGRLPYADRISF